MVYLILKEGERIGWSDIKLETNSNEKIVERKESELTDILENNLDENIQDFREYSKYLFYKDGEIVFKKPEENQSGGS